MAKVALPAWLLPTAEVPGQPGMNFSSATLDAVGESTTFIGRAFLSTGPGTSKTFSSAGGKIYFISEATTTFAAAAGGTVVRVGVQDVDATTGLEDGTFDVYDDLVSATDTITQDVITTVTMSSGSKTIAHGDLIAVSFEVTARTAPDQVRPRYSATSSAGFPYCTTDTGSGPGKVTAMPHVTLETDDGTIITFGPGLGVYTVGTVSFSSSSSPDEYALVFQVNVEMQVDMLGGCISEVDTTEDGELLLYSDPLGTPSAMATVTIDPDVQGAAALVPRALQQHQIALATLSPSTNYAVAYRPTSTAVRSLTTITIPTAAARAFLVFGTAMSQYQRENNTGAFVTQNTTTFPLLGVHMATVETGGGSGGMTIHPGMTGGMQG